MRVSNPFSMPKLVPTKPLGQNTNVDNRHTLQRMGRFELNESIKGTMLDNYINGSHPNRENIAEGLTSLGRSIASLINIMLPHQKASVDSALGGSSPNRRGLNMESVDLSSRLEALYKKTLPTQYLHVCNTSRDSVGLIMSPAKDLDKSATLYMFTDILNDQGAPMPNIEISVFETVLTKLYELGLLSESQLSNMKVYDTTQHPNKIIQYTPAITETEQVYLS